MAIVEKGQGVNVGETEIADNDSGALNISSSDGNAVITVDTSDGAEVTRLSAAGAAGVEVHAVNSGGANNAEVRLADEVGFIADPDCMIRRSNSNELEFRFVSTDVLKINASGAYVENGNLGVGTLSPAHKAHVQDGDIGIVTNNADDATAKSLVFARSRSNTDGTAVVVQDDDILGNIEFKGAEDGDSYAIGAKIFARVNGTPGDGDMPTELVFQTSRDGTETPETRFSISEKGIGAFTSDNGSASVITVGREGLSDSMEIRVGTGMELNTIGTSSLKIVQSYKEVADFNGETLVLENISSSASSEASGGLWVNLANTCTSSGTGNRTIASTGHKLKVGDAVSLRSGNSNAYEVFTVASVTDADTFEVDSDLTNAITSQIGKTDGIKLKVNTGDGALRFAVAGDGVMTLGTNPGTETNNIAIGDSDSLDTLTTGESNIIIGSSADNYKLTSGGKNVFIGHSAGEDMQGAQNSVHVGFEAGAVTNNSSNVFVGAYAGKNATGFETVAVGKNAHRDCTGDKNVAVGTQALDNSSTATECTAVGFQSLSALTGSSVDFGSNTGLGFQSGLALTSGQQCTFLGAEATTSASSATLNNQTAIGFGATTDAANQVRVGNTSVSDIDGQVALTATSDARVKTNVEDLSLGLDFINALRPVSFSRVHPADWPEEIRDERYKRGRTVVDEDGNETIVSTANFDVETQQPIKEEFDSTTRSEGLIAQEVKAACEALGVEFNGIKENSSGKMGIQYSLLVAPLIRAVQQLTSRIEQLESGS